MGLNSQDKTNAADQAVTVIANGDVPAAGETSARVEQKTSGEYALHVITELSSVSSGATPSLPADTVWEDMNATTGGIARGTSLGTGDGRTVVYSYTGSGLVYGWLVSLETMATKWRIYMKTDGNENFGSTGILTDDFKSNALYGYDTSVPNFHMGLATQADNMRFQGNLSTPLKFSTSFEVSVERIDNPSKNFQAGLVSIYKAT